MNAQAQVIDVSIIDGKPVRKTEIDGEIVIEQWNRRPDGNWDRDMWTESGKPIPFPGGTVRARKVTT